MFAVVEKPVRRTAHWHAWHLAAALVTPAVAWAYLARLRAQVRAQGRAERAVYERKAAATLDAAAKVVRIRHEAGKAASERLARMQRQIESAAAPRK